MPPHPHSGPPTPAPAPVLLSQSPAFREAALRSEVRRAYAVVLVVVLVILLLLSRGLLERLDPRLLIAGAAGISALFALQVITLGFVSWARRRERLVPRWFTLTTVVIESLIPSAMMIANITSGALGPYQSMLTPPLVANGLMLTLTTLRLNPAYCILSGATAALAYGGILYYATNILGVTQPPTGLPWTAYNSIAVMLLISGVASAWVAREIRTHAEAALGEAETRREMARIEQDLAVARSIQQALIPRAAPDIPGFEIAGWNRPADLTGGDYYDWQEMPDGNWIITLADVSGHGIGPAMVTAACRAYARASTLHHADLPSLTSRINRLLADDLPEGRFITMVSVLIDPRRAPMALLSAGHGPIVLYVGAKGVVEDILPQGVPLAIQPDTSFGPDYPLAMAPGDVLALVTDGFVEWSRPDADGKREQFGLARLRDSLRRHCQLPAAAMIEAITADVAAFANGERQQDDLTMVVIRRTS